MMKGLIRIGRHSLYNVRLLSSPRQVQPIVFRNPKLPVYVKKATLQNMLETMVKPLTPDELKNVLRSLLTVDDPSLVMKCLEKFLPSPSEITPEQLTLSLQCCSSINKPDAALDLFNRIVAAAPKVVNVKHATALLKSISTSKFSSPHYSLPGHKRNDDDNSSVIANTVMEGVAVYFDIVHNPAKFPRVKHDFILALSMLSMCSSIPTQVAKKNARFLDACLDVLVSLKVIRHANVDVSAQLVASELHPDATRSLLIPVIVLAGKSGALPTAEMLFKVSIESGGLSAECATAMMTAYNYLEMYKESRDLCTTLIENSLKEGKVQKDNSELESNTNSELSENKVHSKGQDVGPDSTARQSVCWPNQRTMYAFLLACSKGHDGRAAVVKGGLEIFFLWLGRTNVKTSGLDWGVCQFLAELSVSHNISGLSQHEQSSLSKLQHSSRKRIVDVVICGMAHVYPPIPQRFWCSAAAALAVEGKMDVVFENSQVTKPMFQSIARSLAVRGQWRDLLALASRARGYSVDDQTMTTIQAATAIALLETLGEKKATSFLRRHAITSASIDAAIGKCLVLGSYSQRLGSLS